MSSYTDLITRLQNGERECPNCEGTGEVEAPFQNQCISPVAECPPDPVMVDCEECQGEGWRALTDEECAEAAERQAEERAEAGWAYPTLAEQHRAAWIQKQELRK